MKRKGLLQVVAAGMNNHTIQHKSGILFALSQLQRRGRLDSLYFLLQETIHPFLTWEAAGLFFCWRHRSCLVFPAFRRPLLESAQEQNPLRSIHSHFGLFSYGMTLPAECLWRKHKWASHIVQKPLFWTAVEP